MAVQLIKTSTPGIDKRGSPYVFSILAWTARQ